MSLINKTADLQLDNRIQELMLVIASKERQGEDRMEEKARLDELLKWKHIINIIKGFANE